MATNRRLVGAGGSDFYVTPAWGTLALLKYERFEGPILEPCCGDGAMVRVMRRKGYEVVASDLYDRGFGRCRDFFSYRRPVANIVTNPPFNIAEDVLEHALGIAERKVCLLLRTAFLEGKRRWENFYSSRPPARLLTFSRRLSMYPAGSDRKSGGTQSYSWFIWDAEYTGPTVITWTRP